MDARGITFGWLMLASAGLAGGCQSSTPAPQDMARTSLGTAPADLQLMCASAAAGPTGVDSSRILPTSSAQLDAANYRVDLDAAGSKYTCLIDSSGSVKSVSPAAAATGAAPVPAGAG